MVFFLIRKGPFFLKHKKVVVWYFKILMLILGNFPRFCAYVDKYRRLGCMSVSKVLEYYYYSQVVYIAPLKAIVRERMNDWKKRLVSQLGKKMVCGNVYC